MTTDLCFVSIALLRLFILQNLPTRFTKKRKLYSATVVLLFAITTAVPGIAASENVSEGQSKTVETENLQPEGLAQLIPKSNKLNEKYARLMRELSTLPAGKRIESQLKTIEAQKDSLAADLAEMKQQKRRRYDRLLKFRDSLAALNLELVVLNEPLIDGLRKIDQWRSNWMEELKHWQAWKSNVHSEDMDLPMVKTAFDSAINVVTTARKSIVRKMEPMMAAQKRVLDEQAEVNEIIIEVDSLIADARGEFLRDFSPPMFSPSFFSQFGSWLTFEMITGVAGVAITNLDFFIRKSWVIVFQLILALSIPYGIRKSDSVLKGIESLRFIRRNPYSVGLLISSIVCWELYEPLPTIWKLLLVAIILTTTARLVGYVVANRRRNMLVYFIVACMFAINLLISIQFPPPLFRTFLVSAASSLGMLSMHSLLRPHDIKRSRISIAILIGLVLTCAIVTVIEIIGYSSLALHIFRSTLTTIFIIFLSWLLMLIVRGLLESAFRSRSAQKIPLLRTQATKLIDRTSKLLNLMVLLLFCGAVLETWRVSTSSWELIHQVFAFGVTIGETQITLWLVLTAAAFLYGAVIASRIVQFFMMRKLFTQFRVDPGIGQSVTRLMHYTIVLLGILLALATLGFELTNLTIIASALSVGIGFGLQTIVNNFVCGLILLFERPVKVGDIVQIGEEWATIRDIGLRATTIQTFNRSDIVVPNSDLITNQVTNWTLADRKMRLSLNVGVAYGSEVPLVLQTLEECTRGNRHILRDPDPLILFMGFGDSSLDFQLRVWIDNLDFINVVRSELNQEIDRLFRERRIEIPFPQRDLHLRSVDPTAANELSASSQVEAAGKGNLK
jgi:potassium efflux system protein